MALPHTKQKELQALWRAYWETPYFNQRIQLVPGQKTPVTPDSDTVTLWLTAENPHSQPCDKEENQRRNQHLASEITKLLTKSLPQELIHVEAATARHPNHQWPAEQGFFVFMPAAVWAQTRSEWETLAARWGQNAIVVAEPGKPVIVMPTDPMFRQQLTSAGLWSPGRPEKDSSVINHAPASH